MWLVAFTATIVSIIARYLLLQLGRLDEVLRVRKGVQGGSLGLTDERLFARLVGRLICRIDWAGRGALAADEII